MKHGWHLLLGLAAAATTVHAQAPPGGGGPPGDGGGGVTCPETHEEIVAALEKAFGSCQDGVSSGVSLGPSSTQVLDCQASADGIFASKAVYEARKIDETSLAPISLQITDDVVGDNVPESVQQILFAGNDCLASVQPLLSRIEARREGVEEDNVVEEDVVEEDASCPDTDEDVMAALEKAFGGPCDVGELPGPAGPNARPSAPASSTKFVSCDFANPEVYKASATYEAQCVEGSPCVPVELTISILIYDVGEPGGLRGISGGDTTSDFSAGENCLDGISGQQSNLDEIEKNRLESEEEDEVGEEAPEDEEASCPDTDDDVQAALSIFGLCQSVVPPQVPPPTENPPDPNASFNETTTCKVSVENVFETEVVYIGLRDPNADTLPVSLKITDEVFGDPPFVQEISFTGNDCLSSVLKLLNGIAARQGEDDDEATEPPTEDTTPEVTGEVTGDATPEVTAEDTPVVTEEPTDKDTPEPTEPQPQGPPTVPPGPVFLTFQDLIIGKSRTFSFGQPNPDVTNRPTYLRQRQSPLARGT